MRAAMGAIQRLKKDYYKISMEAERHPDGRRRRVTKNVRGTREEAEAALARMKLDAGKPVRTKLAVKEYWDTFYEPTLESLAPSTAQGYRSTYNAHVLPLFGQWKMTELRAHDIERGLSTIERPGAQRNTYKLLRQMFGRAYRDEMLDENPFNRRIKLKRMEKYEPAILLMTDLPAWIKAVRGSRWEPVLLVMLFGGLRREEACALFWEDLSFSNGACAVRVSKTLTEVSGKLHDGPTKTAESRRTVFLAGLPAQRLADLELQGPRVPLVADANGNRMAPDKISREYHKLMEGKDAKYVPLRNLRNSYATIMQGLGVSDSLISKSLGHTELRTDYAHYFAANAPAHLANAKMLGDAVGDVLRLD